MIAKAENDYRTEKPFDISGHELRELLHPITPENSVSPQPVVE
jgi:hypothetical protein